MKFMKFSTSNLFNTPQKWAYWLLSIIIIFVVYFLLLDHFAPSTDDATVQAYVINVTSYDQGKIIQLDAKENQSVQKGDLLFVLDPKPYEYAYLKAKSNFDYAQAHFLALKKSYDQGAISRDQFLSARSDYLTAFEALQTASLDLTHTKVYAEESGYITNLQVRVGSYINAGGAALTLIDKTHFWIQANLKENDLERVLPGQKVKFSLNNLPAKVFIGQVETIGPGVSTSDNGEGSLLPNIEKTNNWVNLAQRFPVRVSIDDFPKNLLNHLRVGTTAIITVYTTDNKIINAFADLNQWIRTTAQYLY